MASSWGPNGNGHVSPAAAARAGGTTLRSLRPAVLLLAKACFIPLTHAAPLSTIWPTRHTLAARTAHGEDAPEAVDGPNLYVYLGVAIALVLLGGAFAGLTIALMGQDETYLQVIATSGDGSERKNAAKVLNLLKKGKHWVLVTLLLSNVITNETLPIVLDRSLGGGWPAVLSSTVLIVIFGEIAPQSVCVRYGLGIGAFCAPFVLVLMWIMCPVAWPTAKLLDYLLGEDHGTMYKKAGLKTLVQLHKSLGTTPGERLMEDEVTIINSVLDLKDKPVGNIMTPMQDVFTMSADTVLDEGMMDTILSQGYSRIPIYAPDNNRNFIGMLLVKILITYDPEDAMRVRDFALATLPETAPHTSCLDIINFFQEGKSHMVLVSDYPGQDRGALGVVTLEDVIEELIGEEIIDESDVFIDVHKAIRRLAPAPKQKFGRTTSHEPTKRSDDREPKETDALLPKDGGSRKPSLSNGHHPGTTFLMRRRSSGALSAGPYHVNSSNNDVKPHLRHLAPSNVASNPRETKSKSVKVKPGLGTIPQGEATTTGIEANKGPSRSQSMDFSTQHDGGGGAGLPKSAGKEASDGAVALISGYGALNDGSPPRARRLSTEQMSPHEASKVAELKASSPKKEDSKDDDRKDRLRVPSKLVVGSSGDGEDEDDQVGDLEGPSRERSKSRRAARSGSITETTIDVGGLKKTVLETNSGSSDEAEGNGTSQRGGSTADEGDLRNGDLPDGNKDDAGEHSAGQNGKRRRKRRDKKKKDSE